MIATGAGARHTTSDTPHLDAPHGGANIHQIANNRRPSVQMIEQFYDAHIKNRIDASAINVMGQRLRGKRRGESAPKKESAPQVHH